MTNNKRLLTKLAYLGVLKTEPVNLNSITNENDIIITKYDDSKEKVILNIDTTNEELLLLIETEKLETIKSIKSMIKFFVIFTIIGVGIWLLGFLIELGSKV